MTNDKKKSVTESEVSEIKKILTRKTAVVKRAGNLEAFAFMESQARLAKLLAFKEIKESDEYKGVPYIDENGDEKHTTNIKEFCKYLLGESASSLNEDLQNINILGQNFFEKADHLKLGQKQFRKLRQLPEAQQLAVINSEEVDLGDKTAVKELIEDLVIQHNNEKTELTKQVKEANHTVKAARDISSEKQQELDVLKEQEHMRQFKQAPWQRNALDSVNAMIEARGAISQGANQLLAVLNNLSENHELDDKAIDHIGRSLLSEAQHNLSVISDFCNDAFSILGDRYHPDLTADELFNQLHANEETISAE